MPSEPAIKMMLDITLLLLASASNALATLSLKFGDSGLRRLLGSHVIPESLDLGLIAGIAFYGLSLVSYSAVLKNLSASIAYPAITGLAILIVVATSTLLAQEKLTLPLALGILFVVAGIALISLNADQVS